MVDIVGMGKLYYLKIQTHSYFLLYFFFFLNTVESFCVQVEVTTDLDRHIRTLELSGINKAGNQ